MYFSQWATQTKQQIRSPPTGYDKYRHTHTQDGSEKLDCIGDLSAEVELHKLPKAFFMLVLLVIRLRSSVAEEDRAAGYGTCLFLRWVARNAKCDERYSCILHTGTNSSIHQETPVPPLTAPTGCRRHTTFHPSCHVVVCQISIT